MINIAHNFSDQILSNRLVALKLREYTCIKDFSKLAHPLEPKIFLLQELLQCWKPVLVEGYPCTHFINCFHALISFENELMMSDAESDSIYTPMQVKQLLILFARKTTWNTNPGTCLACQVFEDVDALLFEG